MGSVPTPHKIQENPPCNTDKDCDSMHRCIKSFCEHKKFFPIESRDVLGVFIILICTTLASAAGTGGGSFFSPIIIVVFGFATHEAIPLSTFTVFSVCLFTFFFTMNVKHPYRDTIALDYNIAGMIIPSILLGSTFGVILNKILPFSIILIGLIMVLLSSTVVTSNSAYRNWIKEDIEIEEKEKNEIGEFNQINGVNGKTEDEKSELLIKSRKGSDYDIIKEEERSFNLENPTRNKNHSHLHLDVNINSVSSSLSHKEELCFDQEKVNEELELDQKVFSIKNYKYPVLAYLTLVLFLLLRGDDNFKSIVNIKPCSIWYWDLYMFYVPLTILFSILSAKEVISQYNYRVKIGYPYSEDQVKWNYATTITYSIAGLITGIFSGTLGLGGGTILGPLLLSMNTHPIVMKNTCNFVVMISASALTLQFILAGMLKYNYALVFCILAIISSVAASMAVATIIKKYGRPSIVIICVACVFFVSSIIVGLDANRGIKELTKSGKDAWGINSLC